MPRPLSPSEIEDFRDRLCDVATRIFAEKGADGFTMRQLATELSVSPMTPYRYFKDKDEILAAVRARAFDLFADTLEQAYDSVKTPIERSQAVGRGYENFARNHPEAYKLMFDVSQPSERDYPDLVRAGERARKTLTHHLEGLRDAGLIEGDPLLIGTVVWSAFHGALMLQLAGKLPPEISFERIRDEIFGLIAKAYGTQGQS
ncbi:MAG TPA: TetR/AcrR family transcriptional regulator [Rhizomicrobium sp.]|nr:TetR/AcrR family transcriptional regulator [Rhizomicrobium sp.]